MIEPRKSYVTQDDVERALTHVNATAFEDRPWPAAVLANEVRRLRGVLTQTTEVSAPGYVAPTGQQLQPGAYYEATLSRDSSTGQNRYPVVLRRVGLHDAARPDAQARELKRLQRENGRLGNLVGDLRMQIESLRGRGFWQMLQPLADALGCARSATPPKVIELAVAAIRDSAWPPDGDVPHTPPGVNAILYANAYAAETRRVIEQEAQLAARRAVAPGRFTQAVGSQAIVVAPKEIKPDSWLNESRFEAFVRAYKYATSHFSLAAHAFAKVTPEEAHWIWRTVDKGMARNVRLDQEKERRAETTTQPESGRFDDIQPTQ